MSQSFIRENKTLAAKIAACDNAWDIQQICADVPVDEVLRGAEPEQPRVEDYAPLRRVVEVEDGGRVRRFLITGGSHTGLDVLEAGIRRDVKFGLR